MGKVFGENKFRNFREVIYSSYGELHNYSFIRDKIQNGYIYAYYIFHFNKSDIIFRIRIIFSKIDDVYKISGLWIISIASKGQGVSMFIAILLSI